MVQLLMYVTYVCGYNEHTKQEDKKKKPQQIKFIWIRILMNPVFNEL